ncbi:MAG: DUF4296 domain-containing protein [Ignavibacteria bacterium]|nr:DUF4296 domain-containing protein [Ignavibacteria bacterium]
MILFLSGVLFSCENQKIIEEEQFVEVYAKLTLIKELYRDDQAQFFKEREKIFNEYKIDKQKLDATFNYYNEDPERWKLFYEKVINYLDKLQKESTVN